MKPITVGIIHESISFPNAWVRAVNCVMNAEQKITFGGKIPGKDQEERKIAYDYDFTIVLEGNALREAIVGILHPQFPTKTNVLREYLKEWERGYDWKKQGFTYCYEDRIESYAYPGGVCIDQWKLARDDLAEQIESGIQSNRNVIVIGNPFIDRFEIPDSPPCLRELWIRHEGDQKVSVKWKFRSRDLYAAWMTNVIGILSAVMREVIIPNGCQLIQAVDKNDSLHIYKGDWESAKKIKSIPVSPQYQQG